jgi:ubiquitin carboxyl-terminal hydrolase 8
LNKSSYTSLPDYLTNKFINLKGTFYNKLLLIELKKPNIYCIFFKDNKGNMRQGYLKINKDNDYEIINKFKEEEPLNLFKKLNIEINDYLNRKNNDKFCLRIFNININNFFKLDFKIENPINSKTSIIPKSKFGEINKNGLEMIPESEENKPKTLIEKMNRDEYKIKNIVYKKEIPLPKKVNIKKENENNIKNYITEISLNNDDTKKVKKKFPRNSSLKNRILKKSSRKLNDGNFDLSQFLPKKPVVNLAIPGIIGLQNIGATCYMNATLQCFSNTPKLRSYLLNKDNYNELENNKVSTNKLSFALAEVLKNLWEVLTQRDYPPNHFKNVISEMNPLFKGIKANDPKDLILFLLETMHNELNKAPNKNLKTNYIDDTYFESVFYDFYQNYMNKNKSIIAEEFNGYTNSMTSCGYCRTTIHNVQTFNILFFPLEEIRKFMNYKHNNVLIKDCFQFYQKNNIFPSFYCNKCKYLCQSINTNRLIYTPQTLIINLNRGRGLEYNVNIIFDEYLNIREFIFSPESPYYYELTGVICHFGSNDEGGHFIAYCKNSNNCEWYKFNDSYVSKCYFYEVQNANLPYVLFYNYVQV